MFTYNVWDTIDIIFRREHRETALHHCSLSLKKRQIKYLFFHFYFLNMDILLTNKLPIIKLYTDIENTHMEGTVSQISYFRA